MKVNNLCHSSNKLPLKKVLKKKKMTIKIPNMLMKMLDKKTKTLMMTPNLIVKTLLTNTAPVNKETMKLTKMLKNKMTLMILMQEVVMEMMELVTTVKKLIKKRDLEMVVKTNNPDLEIIIMIKKMILKVVLIMFLLKKTLTLLLLNKVTV